MVPCSNGKEPGENYETPLVCHRACTHVRLCRGEPRHSSGTIDPPTMRIPMTVVGFDPEVAAANGYPTVPPVSAFSTDVVTGIADTRP